VTSLQARCAVIAAANPLGGTYNSALNFNDNVDLTEPILSRFDVLAVIKDEVEAETDDALAAFVINSHMKSHPEVNGGKDDTTEDWLKRNLLEERKGGVSEKDLIPQHILKKYIIYARKHVHPKLNEIDKEKVTKFYADIRRESMVAGGLQIAVRHIESVLRMSEAHAKMHLRDYVRSDDIDQAIDMLLTSFLDTQKTSIARPMAKRLEQYRPKKTDPNQLLIHLLHKMVQDRALYEKYMKSIEEAEKIEVRIPIDTFEHETRDYGAHGLQEFYKSSLFSKEFMIQERNIVCTYKL